MAKRSTVFVILVSLRRDRPSLATSLLPGRLTAIPRKEPVLSTRRGQLASQRGHLVRVFPSIPHLASLLR
jgi:hypothetical protein